MKTTEPTAPVATPVVLSFKGFGSDLKCRDFQYAIGEAYEHAGVVGACIGGFHACEYASPVWTDIRQSRSRVTWSG